MHRKNQVKNTKIKINMSTRKLFSVYEFRGWAWKKRLTMCRTWAMDKKKILKIDMCNQHLIRIFERGPGQGILNPRVGTPRIINEKN